MRVRHKGEINPYKGLISFIKQKWHQQESSAAYKENIEVRDRTFEVLKSLFLPETEGSTVSFKSYLDKIANGKEIDIIRLNNTVSSIISIYPVEHQHTPIAKTQQRLNILNNIIIEIEIVLGNYEKIDQIIATNPDLELFPTAIGLAIKYPGLHKIEYESIEITPEAEQQANTLISTLCNRINPKNFPSWQFFESLTDFKTANQIVEHPDVESHIFNIATRYSIAAHLITTKIDREQSQSSVIQR